MKTKIIIVLALMILGACNEKKESQNISDICSKCIYNALEKKKELQKDTIFIPVKPFVIISFTVQVKDVVNYSYIYEIVDKNGNIFHFEELSAFNKPPKRMVGDIIQ